MTNHSRTFKARSFFALLSLLISMGLSLQSCHNPYYDDPPIHEAARRGNAKKVLKLINEGVSPNAKNREGATPLHWAAFKGHIKVCETLLNRGAKVNARTSKGNTALQLALDHKQEKVAKYLKSRGGRT